MDPNLVLYVASYADTDSAEADLKSLKDAQDEDFAIVGAVVMTRDADGKVEVKEQAPLPSPGAFCSVAPPASP